MNEDDSLDQALDEAGVDPAMLQRFVDYVRASQSLPGAIVGAVLGAVLGVLIWMLLLIISGRELVLTMCVVGLLAGTGARRLGRGIELPYGAVAAVTTLVAYVVGRILTVAFILSVRFDSTLLERLQAPEFFDMLRGLMDYLDLLSLGGGMFIAFRVSFRRVRASEIPELVHESYSATSSA